MESYRNISTWLHSDVNDIVMVSHSKLPETYIISVVLTIVFLVGVLGNGTLVFVFAQHPTMRNVPNTYIFSLALGDLLVILFCVCFTFVVYMTESWTWGELICKLTETTRDVSIGVSVFSLTALSAERYCAIVNPIRNHIPSKSHTIIMVIIIWIISLVLALPAAILSNVESVEIQGNYTIKYCSTFSGEYGIRYQKVIVVFKCLAHYAIPLCFITGFYGLMSRHLMLSTRILPGEHSLCKDQSNQIQARKKVAKMVLSIAITFMICFLPYHISMLWFYFNPSSVDDYDGFWHFFRIVALWLSYINSCINPIVLYFMSKAFRQYFNQYLFCCVKPTVENAVYSGSS